MSNLKVIEYSLFEDNFDNKIEETNDNICHILINNTPNIDKSVELLSKNCFKKLFEKYQKLVSLIFKINDEIDYNFDIKSILLCLGLERTFMLSFQSSLGEHQSKTCWKIQDCDKFYSIYIDDDSSECVTAFFHEFLVDEVQNKRTGIQENFQLKEKIRLSEIGDENGQNLLLLAVLKNRQIVVEKLLQHDFNADDVINQAWKSYIECNDNDKDKKEATDKIVLELLKSNSRIPNDFDYNRASENVKKFIDKCESMHSDVTEDKFDDLKVKLDSEPNLIYFYNRENQSLLDCALEFSKFKIFDYLDHGLTVGCHEDLEIAYETLGNDEIKSLRRTNQQNSKIYEENHLLVLKLNSRIGNNEQQHHKRWNLIEEALITINQNSYCRKILKVAAECKKLKIYFDFKHDSTYYLDPASSVYSQGIIYSGGSIFIGAKHLKDEASKFHVFGVLAHELCHLATLLTFMNPNFDPFPLGESQEKTRFDNQVMVECNHKKELDPKVENVFISYPGNYQNSEMIVVYPQILMTYFGNQEKIEKFEDDFKELVKYSKEVVEPELDKALSVLKILNDEERSIKFNKLTVSMKAKILHSKINFQGVETTLLDVIGNDQQILKCLMSEDIRKVLLKNEKIIIGKIYEQKLDFAVERHFLDQHQNELLDQYKYHSKAYKEFMVKNRKTFNDICNDTKDSKVFILADHAGTGKTTFFNYSALELKQENPNFWISLIDLRKSRNVCKNINKNSSSEELLPILLELVDTNSEIEKKIFTKLFFEGKIIFLFDGFDEISPCFTQQILNVFKHLRNGTKNKNGSYTKNQVWISTRPHYESKLKEVFNNVGHLFAPFTREEKKEIINKVLILNQVQDDKKQSEIMDKVLNDDKVIDAFKKFTYAEIDNIMMIQMITELHINNQSHDKNFNHNNLYELFTAMIRLQKKKIGEKIPNLERDNDSKLTVWDVHRALALILIFGDNFKEFFGIDIKEFSIVKKWEKDKKNWTSDMIQRYGFVVFNLEDPDEGNAIEFIHKTYAEFFVAQFIVNLVYDDHEETSQKEIERIVDLFLTLAVDHDAFERINVFIINFLISKEKNKQLHQKVKKLFYPLIIEAHETLAGPIDDDLHRFFRKYFLPISCVDSDVSKKFWKLESKKNFLEELVFKDLNINDVALLAEISFGTNWHEKFNKSGIKLITDEEIDKLPLQDDNGFGIIVLKNFNALYGSNFDNDKNFLKLCDLISKSFSIDEQIKFFENLNLQRYPFRSSIQCAVILIMKSILPNTSFTFTLLKHLNAKVASSKTLELIFKCIEEVFEGQEESLWQILYKVPWNRFTSPLIKSFYVSDIKNFEIISKFYIKYKKSWSEIRNHLNLANAEDLFHPVSSKIYPAYKKFIENVYKSNTKTIADKIENYLNGQNLKSIASSLKNHENNFKDFLLYILSKDEVKVGKILSKMSKINI